MKIVPKSSALRTGLNIGDTKAIADLLNLILSNDMVLLMKVWGFHWNMVGPDFLPVHTFFNDLYESLVDDIDATGERIRAIGQRANGSLVAMLKSAIVKEDDNSNPMTNTRDILFEISGDYDNSVKQMRDILSKLSKFTPIDEGNLNYVQDLLMRREKYAWFLRSHLTNN